LANADTDPTGNGDTTHNARPNRSKLTDPAGPGATSTLPDGVPTPPTADTTALKTTYRPATTGDNNDNTVEDCNPDPDTATTAAAAPTTCVNDPELAPNPAEPANTADNTCDPTPNPATNTNSPATSKTPDANTDDDPSTNTDTDPDGVPPTDDTRTEYTTHSPSPGELALEPTVVTVAAATSTDWENVPLLVSKLLLPA
jgi:hypothetical protein